MATVISSINSGGGNGFGATATLIVETVACDMNLLGVAAELDGTSKILYTGIDLD